jgi:HPt (histidine-containing phosphotransfer) domain-containing protein
MVELDVELARLWATHSDEIAARMATIEAAVVALDAGALDDASRVSAARAAHQLAGTAGTFGFAAASEQAAAVEVHLTGRVAGADGDPSALEPLVVALRAALRGAGT